MHRWDFERMFALGKQLFDKLHKRKYSCNPNHDIHHLARDRENWLPQLVQSLIDGNYATQPSRQYYFDDEVIDQLEIVDRIAHHILLKELKPSFKHIVNQNCYHMLGPAGVKRATRNIEEALRTSTFQYIIRADIKSFYRSIPHYKLIQDIKKIYQDPKIIKMLEDIIQNSIDTPRGFKNPDTGIALRGPLSQLFSAIYLKPVDDAFDNTDVFYARYQDDLLILCKTRSQFNRCRRKLAQVFQERRLGLSRKKSRCGPLNTEFHFLGINYSRTQTSNNTTRIFDDENRENNYARATSNEQRATSNEQRATNLCHSEIHCQKPLRMSLHARTFRKAREQVRLLITDGFSATFIKNYLIRWARWWVEISSAWKLQKIMNDFFEHSWNIHVSSFAMTLLPLCITADSRRCAARQIHIGQQARF